MNITRKRFMYLLRNSAGQYYYAAGGVVATSSTLVPLRKDPVDFRETNLQWKRNARYWGVFRAYVNPLSFVLDGATILRNIYYTQGIEGDCTLVIKRLDNLTQGYVDFYEGAVDFSQAQDTRTHFQVAILDGGLPALLKAYETTPQELEITDADCLNAFMTGLRLRNNSVLSLANDFTATDTWHQMMPTISIQSNESEVQVDVIAQPIQQGIGATFMQNFPFFKATIACEVAIDYDISIQVGNSAGSSLGALSFVMVIVQTYAAGGPNTAVQLYRNPNFTSYVGLNLAKGQASFTVSPGDTLCYFAGLFNFNATAGSDAFLVDMLYNYSTLKVSYDLSQPDSTARAFRYNQFWQKLVSKMTGGLYQGQSSFLSTSGLVTRDNKPFNTCVTVGNALRGLGHGVQYIALAGGGPPRVIPADWTKITTTFADLQKDAADRWMAGIGVEKDFSGNDVAVLEHGSHFFDASRVMLRLGEVTSVLIQPALDYVYNVVKVGSSPVDLDALNGKDEPCASQTYSIPIIRKKADWDMVSPYRPDMYGVEFMRSQLLGKDTTDNKSDKDVFLFEIGDTPVTISIPGNSLTSAYPLARHQNDAGNSATGLIAADRAFNLSLSPKRNFLRNGAMIHTAAHLLDAKTITFQTADKNPDMVSNLGSGDVIESADVPISSLDAPLFLPFTIQFETKVPSSLPNLLTDKPYGLIGFKYRGNEYFGFIDEIAMKPGDNDKCTWKLLAAPSTDISKLIH